MRLVQDQKLLDGIKQIQTVEKAINAIVRERSELIYGMIVGTISQDGVIVLGPPGTAKTMAGRLWANAIDPLKVFMLTGMPANPPEMLYGAVDIDTYTKTGEFYRNTKGMMPDNEFLLWDEADKESDTNRTGAYSIIHPEERRYFNGSKGMQDCKTKFAYLTMNQYDNRDILVPFFDRIALKYEVEYIKDNNVKSNYLKDSWNKPTKQTINVAPIGWDVLQQLNDALSQVDVTPEAMKAFEKIYDTLRNDGIQVSDRRFSWVPRIAKACALYDGRMEVEDTDLLIAKNILWDELEDRPAVADAVMRCVDNTLSEAKRIYSDTVSNVSAIEIEISRLVSERSTLTPIQDKTLEANGHIQTAITLLTEKSNAMKRTRKNTSQIDEWISELNQTKRRLVNMAYSLD